MQFVYSLLEFGYEPTSQLGLNFEYRAELSRSFKQSRVSFLSTVYL